MPYLAPPPNRLDRRKPLRLQSNPEKVEPVSTYALVNPIPPAGGLSAGRGRHGSMKLDKGRERERGDMRPLIALLAPESSPTKGRIAGLGNCRQPVAKTVRGQSTAPSWPDT